MKQRGWIFFFSFSFVFFSYQSYLWGWVGGAMGELCQFAGGTFSKKFPMTRPNT